MRRFRGRNRQRKFPIGNGRCDLARNLNGDPRIGSPTDGKASKMRTATLIFSAGFALGLAVASSVLLIF
jgi:hypothetical protein